MNAHLPPVLAVAFAPLIASQSVLHDILSDEDWLAADRKANTDKSDPAAFDAKIHRLHADEVSMLRHLRALP